MSNCQTITRTFIPKDSGMTRSFASLARLIPMLIHTPFVAFLFDKREWN